jgi:hypothetical protein
LQETRLSEGISMADRRTYASVTDVPCGCGYLERAADDPAGPIVFDEQTSEYQFVYQEPDCDGRSMLVIYHCPFCGGKAPASKRHLLFAAISAEEEQRLAQLLAPIKTTQQAFDAFGPPQADGFSVARETRRDDPSNPPMAQRRREVFYKGLSDVADVRITELPDGRVSFTLLGKYTGE